MSKTLRIPSHQYDERFSNPDQAVPEQQKTSVEWRRCFIRERPFQKKNGFPKGIQRAEKPRCPLNVSHPRFLLGSFLLKEGRRSRNRWRDRDFRDRIVCFLRLLNLFEEDPD